MTPQHTSVASLKAFIESEIATLRAEVRRKAAQAGPTGAAGVGVEASATPTAAGSGAAPCPCGQGSGAAHGCADADEKHDPWACLCSTLPAIPLSAALLSPVRDDSGAVTDFVIRAGNHIRSAQWLLSPDQQVGQRFMAARPGAATGGLLSALSEVLESGRSLNGLTVDYTEERHDGLRRVQLVHYAASCGDQVLTTWGPVHSQAESLTIDVQHLASMGWGRWDLLSGAVSWSEGLQKIFRADPHLPWSLMELCDALAPADVGPFGEFIASVLAGEEPAWTRIRFRVLGEVRTVDLLGRPVAGTDGRPWALQIVARDLTPQMRSRRRLVEKQAETEQLRQQAAAEQHVASTLREALLPTYSEGLAELGLAVAAAYLPAEPEAAVGGDWYKCRPLPDGRALIAIGDASGHGLEAVARMAQQRHAVAGLAQTGAGAGDITTWLNELVGGDPTVSTATMSLGHIGEDRVFRWACAGHPAPLVLRGNQSFTLPTDHRGPLLGAVPGYRYKTAEFPMEQDDVLLLYTDGVVERRGQDIDESIRTLSDALTAARNLTPQRIIDRLTEDYGSSTHDDDACLLAIRVD